MDWHHHTRAVLHTAEKIVRREATLIHQEQIIGGQIKSGSRSIVRAKCRVTSINPKHYLHHLSVLLPLTHNFDVILLSVCCVCLPHCLSTCLSVCFYKCLSARSGYQSQLHVLLKLLLVGLLAQFE